MTTHDPDPSYAEEVAKILDAALAWQAGRLPLADLLALGAIPYRGKPNPKYSRNCALRSVPRGDPARVALQAAIEAARVTEPVAMTRFGAMTEAELHQHDPAVDRLGLGDPWERF